MKTGLAFIVYADKGEELTDAALSNEIRVFANHLQKEGLDTVLNLSACGSKRFRIAMPSDLFGVFLEENKKAKQESALEEQ